MSNSGPGPGMDTTMDQYGFCNTSSRTTGSFTKGRSEDGDGRSSTTEECDSTTEPANHKVQFQIGDDVFYQEETGQNVLGTVELVQGKKVKIIFMDGTEKLAHISKVKKLSFSFNEEDDDDSKNSSGYASNTTQALDGAVTSASKKKTKSDINGQIVPKENLQVTCGSCGTQKMIASKKALEYSPYTAHQYNCRKCINKSKTGKNNGVPLPLAAHYLAAARGRPKVSDSSTMPKGILDQGIANGIFRQDSSSDICLHCRTQIAEKVSLHCTMCERPCHPSCLALTPPPLPGDTFWSIICHVCGTQKPDGSPENDSQKLYSSRRSITCWSDVAYLLLSCLGCKYTNEKFFDLDEQIIPFWEENLARLHLPRQYKTAEPTERRKLLLLALNNANLRFCNDDEKKKTPLWAIKDHTYKGYNVQIKPPVVAAGRAVTAAGFPISVRTSNPEAASVAMTNIAQTIAANKANSVPTPKNSPSLIPPKSNTTMKTSGAVAPTGRKLSKHSEHPPVAKKSGSEVNAGAQRPKYNDIWPQSRYTKTTFLSELPKSGPNNAGSAGIEETNPNSSKISGGSKSHSVAQQSNHHKHSMVLSASPGGAARVTGMIISSSSSSSSGVVPEVTSKSNCGSYPVRKNGSPMLNRSIRVEPVERKKDADFHQHSVKPYRFDVEGVRKTEQELIRESPGFNNASDQKLPVKRKLIPTKSTETSTASISKVLEGQPVSSEAKKLKMSLPNSTDITSQRVPSPTKPPDVDSVNKGPKKTMSPLQKLSDLQRNGGLTVACLTQTESGLLQTVAINASALDDGNLLPNGNDSNDRTETLKLSHEKLETPVKKSTGATDVKIVDVGKPVLAPESNTKEKPTVTTSPRAFKLASVSSPGTSKTSPIAERRMARPVRLKRTVAANVEKVEQSKDTNSIVGKPNAGKKVNGKGSTAAAALVAKASRGRPKKPFKLQLRKPSGMTYNIGQFNGPVKNGAIESATSQTINESDYSWNNSTINDLLEFGHGYRLECLPRCPDKKDEITEAAVKHFREEITPRPPSYWSTSSNHSKKPRNQKSRKDLKNVDSYYISGRRIDENGIQYQVVWRDGYGFEYSSDEEEELGVGLGEDNYLCFEDYDHLEYFLDKMPVTVDSSTDHCDSNKTASEHGSDNKGGDEEVGSVCFINKGNVHNDVAMVKREPIDSAENSPVKAKKILDKASVINLKSVESRALINEPMIIDLTDSP